ncbi:unnamed protein product [Paramecium sonneborni]|uniref:Uncharacterized protein n=1 Tax=Paramecium sonneborni TaxID=65129 RepID=A0A8S1RJZ0_9CILI|nr:unnamed protein product [Paramecium sonneborni]
MEEPKTQIKNIVKVLYFNIDVKQSKSNSKLIQSKKSKREDNQDFLRILQKLSKIRENPANIEKIKRNHRAYANEVDKLKMETSKYFELQKILDEFSFRGFQKEDLDTKQYVFGCPKATFDLVSKRKKWRKRKLNFKMKQKFNKKKYKRTRQNISLILSIQKLFLRQACKYNSKSLYFIKNKMIKQDNFQSKENQSNLWINSKGWLNKSKFWLNDELPSIDSVSTEQGIEKVYIILTGVQSLVAKKDISPIQNKKIDFRLWQSNLEMMSLKLLNPLEKSFYFNQLKFQIDNLINNLNNILALKKNLQPQISSINISINQQYYLVFEYGTQQKSHNYINIISWIYLRKLRILKLCIQYTQITHLNPLFQKLGFSQELSSIAVYQYYQL